MIIKLKNKSLVTAVLSIFLLVSMLSFLHLEKSLAAWINNISINLNSSLPNGSGAVAVSFELDTPIAQNGTIEIEFPNTFSSLDTLSSTGSNLGETPVFAVGDTTTTLEITLGTGGTVTGSAVTASWFSLTNPSEDGFYLVQIRTYDENDIILGMGFKLVEIGTPTEIKSKVESSLVVSLDAWSKVFDPDPAINNGQVNDQSTTLTIQTNAKTAYLVTGELFGNKLSSTGGQILSQNSSDDYFRIGEIQLTLESGTGTKANDETTFSGSTTMFNKTSEASTNGDLISINYDLNISYQKDPWIYTGGIVYTVYPTF